MNSPLAAAQPDPPPVAPSSPYPSSPNERDAPFPAVHQPTPQHIHAPIPPEHIHPDLPEGPTSPDPDAVPRRNLDRGLGIDVAAAQRPLVILGGPGWTEDAAARVRHFLERWALPACTAFRALWRVRASPPKFALWLWDRAF